MVEWDVPARLETVLGTINFNDPTVSLSSPGYLPLVEASCKAERSLRVTTDKIPQGDGEIFHRRFRDGTEFTLAVQLWETESEIACGTQKRELYEQLIAHLNTLVNNPGRYFWQPSGYGDERMLEACRYNTPAEVTFEAGVATVTFGIDSPFPYVIDKTQQVINVPNGTDVNIVLPPFSADFFPVMKAIGPVSYFTIENMDVTDEYGDRLIFAYDGTRPGAVNIGAGHYGEIVTFHETMYLDGNSTNLKPGIDPEITDYFYLKAGGNRILPVGCDVTMLVNPAWSVT